LEKEEFYIEKIAKINLKKRKDGIDNIKMREIRFAYKFQGIC